jgi:hypothetical protein
MKFIKKSLAIVALLLSFSAYNHSAQALPLQVSVSFQFFYDELGPYGSWVSYPSYGYVWVPSAPIGFRPYMTGGRWFFTDQGWMWASNYDWGWAPFHYGRWLLDPMYGWVWVPGYDWAPAWVTWGAYNGYYGWAPLAPGFSITIASLSSSTRLLDVYESALYDSQ